MKRTTRFAALTALALLLLVAAATAGCRARGDDASTGGARPRTSSDATPGESRSETASAPQTPTGSPTASTTPDAGAEQDGRYFAYIRAVQIGASGRIIADYAQFLTGDAALTEAKKRGIPEVPNGFLIVNDNTKLRTLPLPENAAVRLASEAQGVRPEGYDIALADFARSFTDRTIPQLQQVPYWLTVKSGAVVRIEEQYLP